MAAQKRKKQGQINLLPQEEFVASTPGRILQWLLSTFRYLVITTEMVVIVAFISRFYFDSRLADLNDEIKQKESYIKAYLEFEKSFKRAQQQLSIFSAMTAPETVLSPLAERIVSKLPPDVSLIQLALLPGDKLSIQASSRSEQSIEQFLVNLDQEQSLSDIALVQADGRASSPFLTFTIVAKMTGAQAQ